MEYDKIYTEMLLNSWFLYYGLDPYQMNYRGQCLHGKAKKNFERVRNGEMKKQIWVVDSVLIIFVQESS